MIGISMSGELGTCDLADGLGDSEQVRAPLGALDAHGTQAGVDDLGGGDIGGFLDMHARIFERASSSSRYQHGVITEAMVLACGELRCTKHARLIKQ